MTSDTPPVENPSLGLFKKYPDRARPDLQEPGGTPALLSPPDSPAPDAADRRDRLDPGAVAPRRDPVEHPDLRQDRHRQDGLRPVCRRRAREGLDPDLALHGGPHQLRGDRYPVPGPRTDREGGRAPRGDLVGQAPDAHPDDRVADGPGLPRAQEPARGPRRRARDRARRDRQARQEERRRHPLQPDTDQRGPQGLEGLHHRDLERPLVQGLPRSPGPLVALGGGAPSSRRTTRRSSATSCSSVRTEPSSTVRSTTA